MATLSEFRAGKDAFFRSQQSPLAPKQRAQFTGLRYFDENPSLRIETRLNEYPNPEHIEMLTSTGHKAAFLKVGWVQFEIAGRPQRLEVYRSEDGDELFLPFMDATSGEETYAGGRYLDLYAYADGTLILDFNQSYNPYCAFDPENWSCPMPPLENRLSVRVEAGEKVFVPADHPG
jgi:uncharacterized protein